MGGNGNIYLAGNTRGERLPVTGNATQPACGRSGPDRSCSDDGVIAVTDAAGALQYYSTYLGGNFDEWAGGVVATASGDAIVTGYTDSSSSLPFPTTPGVVQPGKNVKEDGYVTRIGTKSTTPPPPPAVLRNGDFEQGSNGAWSESSSNFGGAGSLILSSAQLQGNAPRSGNHAVWMGGAPNEVSDLSQVLVVDAALPLLQFYHQVASDDTCGNDGVTVQVNQTTVHTVAPARRRTRAAGRR